MRGWALVWPLFAAAACSGLDEGEGGVVGLEIQEPARLAVDVGEQMQLSARALDADGEPVDVTIVWTSSSDAVSVNATGLLTGVAPGTAQVQAAVGSLASDALVFTVSAPADTIIINGDSVFVLPVVADPPATATLAVRVESRSPAGPVDGRSVIFEITQPVAGETPVVQLTGGVQTDTVTTAGGGIASVTLGAATGQIPPDTAIVQVRANRTNGSPVPGSGQRFIILFQ